MNYVAYYIDYAIELIIVAVFLTFVFALRFFNDAWMALCILYAVSKIIRREGVTLPPAAPFLILFTACVILSVVISHSGFGKVRYLFMGLGTFLFAYDWFSHDWQRLTRVSFYFIVSALLAACVAIYQVLFGAVSLQARVEGSFRNAFYLALWTGTGLFLTIIMLMKSNRLAAQLCCLGAIILLTCAFIISKTRSPWVAMILVLVLTCFFSLNKKTLLMVFGVLVVLFASMAVFDESVKARLLAVAQNGDDLRWPMWQKTVESMIEQFGLRDWLVGRGPGAYSIKLPYEGQELRFVFPHFLPIELLYSFGILGTASFLAWFGILFCRTIRLLRENFSGVTLLPFGLTAFLVFLICFFNESFLARYFSFPFWFFSGISMAQVHLGERKMEKSFWGLGNIDLTKESVAK